MKGYLKLSSQKPINPWVEYYWESYWGVGQMERHTM